MNQRFFYCRVCASFCELLRVFAEQQICKPKLVYQARTYTCTCTSYLYLYLPSCYRGFQAYNVQAFNVQAYLALKRLKPAVTRRKPVPVYLYLVPVPRTCTCTCTSYLYLYLYLVPVPVLVPLTCTCTCTSYLLYLYVYNANILEYSISNLGSSAVL